MNLIVDREDVRAFLDTLPADPDRDRRADALRAAAKIFSNTLGRKREIGSRIEEIAVALIDATGKDRDALIAERGAVASELGTTPVTIKVVTERFAAALVGWCSYAHRQVIDAENQAIDAINARATERRVLIADLAELEGGTRHRERAAAAKAAYDAIQAELQPHHQRQAQARDVAGAISGELRRHFGDEARADRVAPRLVDRYVTSVTKQVA